MKHVILGTAGHIDHGKSTLVKALTGIDPDRLKEEKQRGITIDLGFAYLKYPDDLTVAIVDVPGHEKLVRNMLAGAGGIDFVLLVVAADEGVMPQTKEHLAICNLLGIKSGLVTITKSDLVDEELLALVTEDIKDLLRGTFLEGAEVIPVSAKTGLNLDLLKEKIHDLALKVKPKAKEGPFRLPIDRVFTLKGFGTVVTGTAITGTINSDSMVEILPTGKRARVRGLQSHGESVQQGIAGQRLAINLQGVNKEELHRGDILLSEGYFKTTNTIEVHLRWLPDAPELKSGTPVHVHLFTKEAIGRLFLYDTDTIRPGQVAFGVLKLDRPVVASSGDRFVLRRFSPVETIGGGIVLDPYPVRRRKKQGIEDLKTLLEKGPEERLSLKVLKSGPSGINEKILLGWASGFEPSPQVLEKLVKQGSIVRYGGKLFHRETFVTIETQLVDALKRFHEKNPLKPGIEKEALRALFKIPPETFQMVLELSKKITQDKGFLKLSDFRVKTSESFQKHRERIIEELKKRAFQPPSREELAQALSVQPKEVDDILKLMAQEGSIVRITDTYYLHKQHYQKMLKLLWDHFLKEETLSVGQFRDLLGTSRKYALPFLEHLDSRGITMRVQDVRKKHPSFKEPPE